MYIDALYVHSNNGQGYTGLKTSQTYIGNAKDRGKIDNRYGLKWIIQLTNNNIDSVNVKSYTLSIETYYINKKFKYKNRSKAVKFRSYNLNPNGSIFVGNCFSQAHKVNEYVSNTSSIRYIQDQLIESDKREDDQLYLCICTIFVLKSRGDIVDACGDAEKIGNGNAEGSFKLSPALSCVIGQDIEPLNEWNIPGETFGKWNYNVLPKTIGYIKRISHSNIVAPSPVFDASEWGYGSIVDDDYLSDYTFARAVGGGHVTPLSEEHYFIDSRKYYRFFDNNDTNDRVIINVKYSSGPFSRWEDKGYITHVYICYTGNEAYISTGFRGSYASIIGTTQFLYTDIVLGCDSKAKIYAPSGRFKSNDYEEILRFKKFNPDISLPPRIRNKIKITVNDKYTLFIENVNRFNLQPCRVTLMIKGSLETDDKEYTGIIVDREWCIPIPSITDKTSLLPPDEGKSTQDSTIILTNITPTTLTTPSVELNKEWE